jgi:hypothetical protein
VVGPPDGGGENVGVAIGPQETVLYPVGSRVLAGLVVAICAVVEVSLVVYGHGDVLLRATPAVLLVAVAAIVVFWVPRLELDPAEVRVVNPLRTHVVSWAAIRDIDSRWSLTLDTARGRITAWAAPSPGPFSQLGRARRDLLSLSLSRRREVGGAEQSRSLVVRQWSSYREQGLLGAVEGPGVRTRWNLVPAVALGVLAVATILGAAWP